MLWGSGLLELCPHALDGRPARSASTFASTGSAAADAAGPSEAAGPGQYDRQPPPAASLAASLPARLSGVRRSLSFTRRAPAPHQAREEGAPASPKL